MKPPQEQAERLALKTSTALFAEGRLKSAQVARTTDAILESIPLPELIAVAQAAANLSRYAFMEGSKQRHIDLADLMVKTEALRATRKVEL